MIKTEKIKHAIIFFLQFIFVLTSFVLYSCNDDSPNLAPRKPMFVDKNSDTARVDRGIRPDYDFPKAIRLEWYSNTDNNLGGYELYRTNQTLQGEPVNFKKYRIIVKPDTVFTDLDVGYDTTYYYKLKAYSKTGEVSLFADSIYHYKIIRQAYSLTTSNLSGFSVDSTIVYSWVIPSGAEGAYYVLKSYEDKNRTYGVFAEEDCISVSYNRGRYGLGSSDSIRIDYRQGYVNVGTIKYNTKPKKGKKYLWRLYLLPLGKESFIGSVSELGGFTIPTN